MLKNIASQFIFLSLGIALNLNSGSVQATALIDQEHGEVHSVANSPSMDELAKRFFLVHKTTKVPQGDTLYPAGKNTPYTHTLKDPTCPFSLHWSAFCDFEWKKGAYNVGILSPFAKLKDQIVIVSMTEIATLGPYKLGKEDYLIVPNDFPTVHLPITIIRYPATKSLTQAIQDILKENKLFCICSVPEQAEDEWQDREGIIDDGSQVSPDTFFANFFKMHQHVSLGSEGGIKTGEWSCLALANHYPHLAHQSISDETGTFKLNNWFYVLYSGILNRLSDLADKHQLPTRQFVKDRAKEILSDLKQYESIDLEEAKFSEKVFKVALYSRSFFTLYDQLKSSKGSLENLEDFEREELMKLWTLIYPSISITDLAKIMTPPDQVQ